MPKGGGAGKPPGSGLPEGERRTRIDAARAALTDLIDQQKTLESVAAKIGTPLTLQAMQQAFEKRSADESVRERLAALSWAATACCNHFNVIVQNGSVLAGYRDPESAGMQRPSVTQDYGLLRDNDIISQTQRQLLADLNSARINLTHAYGQPNTSAELHRAVSLALKVLATFGKDYGPWLQSVGIVPKRKTPKE